MTRMSAWLVSLLCAGVVSAATATQASAALYGFTIATFSEGATLNIQFEGADANSDGVIYGYYPPDCGCVPEPTEVTSLSLSFTGNSLIPAFTASSIDFADPLQSLAFDPEFEDGFEQFYVLAADGSGVTFFDMPPGVVAGDAYIDLTGVLPDAIPPLPSAISGNFIDGPVISILGSPCGSVLGLSGGEAGLPCAVLSYETVNASEFDFALQDVPEPISVLGFGLGLAGLAVVRRRRVR